jgi:molybdopterin synthase catalytic subunit
MRIVVQAAPFDPGAEQTAFAAGLGPGAGAVVTFTGLVRDEGGRLAGLEIEHYPGMTERAIAAMAEEAARRFALADALVIHRHGVMAAGEAIMMVATAARHRTDAFAGAEFLMDWLKSRAPFWKKETGPGAAGWVAAREEDEGALARWTADHPRGEDA